ncbi:MAG TPA: PilZ domain-containing protein, partial [Idiomarina loihiensis]|nr:PilZ domain-containing protein [Idiomarina loihiensis]
MTQSQTSMTSPIGDFFTVRDRFPVNLIALDSADSIPDED